MRDSYSLCTVNGASGVGGLVGINNESDLSRSYSAGSVSGENYVGGLIGYNASSDEITGLFWDVEASGQTYSGLGVGKSHIEMMDINTFKNDNWKYDFNFNSEWGINPDENDGYPFLRWQGFIHLGGDSDEDGVADHEDNCPDTQQGVIVNDSGCKCTPGKAELISLTDLDRKINPAFQWVEESCATKYQYWLRSSLKEEYISEWYAAEDICVDAKCSIQTDLSLVSGDYKWWIQSANVVEEDIWSNVNKFTIPAIINISKSGVSGNLCIGETVTLYATIDNLSGEIINDCKVKFVVYDASDESIKYWSHTIDADFLASEQKSIEAEWQVEQDLNQGDYTFHVTV